MSGLELYIAVLPIIVGIIGIQYELHKIRKHLEKNEDVMPENTNWDELTR